MSAVTDVRSSSPMRLQWGRIVAGAIMLEVVLFAVLVPIGLVFGMPGAGNGSDFTIFFTAVPLGCLLFGYLAGWWTGRRVASRHLLHGILVGAIAFVIAGYGATRFWLFNALRLVGCAAGTVSARRPSTT